MDTAGHVLLAAHELYGRAANSTSSSSSSSTANKPASYKIIGLVLALSSGLFIGVSFVLKKVGLLKANAKYNEEAGEGYGYLKNAYWWSGMTLMIMGEICNFAAYLFTDAILVTPLGALSVVITAILSAIFLKERLSFVGKIGCFNCIVGATIIAVNAPMQPAVTTIQEMKKMVLAPGFIVYGLVIIAGCVFTAFVLGPKYGKKTMLVYLTVCSLIGGLSVVGIQGIGAAITAQARGIPQFNQWFLYVLLVFIITTLVTEIIFLNKALNLYNAALVTPTYYVYFTSAVIVSSAVLFQGFKGTPIQILTLVLGFFQICSGVVLLQLSKSAKDVPDTAVFAGDLDQVRTVAEQEEPEYEPRADTIRGSGAILRSISTARQKKQMQEVERLREEHLNPITEGEAVEFDGIRRRRTIIRPDSVGASSRGSLARRKTIHPPLGMSHFPEPEENPDDFHPGIFHFRRKHRSDNRASEADAQASMPLSPLKKGSDADAEHTENTEAEEQSQHVYGLPPGLLRPSNQDLSYKSQSSSAGQHIQFAGDARSVSGATGSTLSPPPVPPHRDMSPRQFSFQNVFHRNRSSQGEPSPRPGMSRSALSFSSRKSSSNSRGGLTGAGGGSGETEEERLGLVKGDSQNQNSLVPNYSTSPPDYDDAHLDPDYDWNADDDDLSSRPSQQRRRNRSPPASAAASQTRDLTAGERRGASLEKTDERPPNYSIDLGRPRRTRDGAESPDSDDEPPQSKEWEGSPPRKPPPGRGPGGAGYI